MNLTEQKVSGINEINLQDSLNAAALEIKIKVGDTVVAPEGNDLIIYVDKESCSNPTSDRKQYVFNLSSPLKSIESVSDEFIQLIDVKNNESKLKTYIKRNIETNDSGNYVLSQSIMEDLESIDITLFEGVNYIYTNYLNAEITIIYPKDNDLNRIFLNSSIYNKHNKLNNEISLDDIYFKDAFTKTGNELNEEIDNLNVKCITSKDNKFSLDSDGNLIVNSITTNNISSSQNNIDKTAICDFIYPVGSIYMSVNNINPSMLFGGNWEQLQDRFLIGAGNNYNVGDIGGSETNKHQHYQTLSNDGNTLYITATPTRSRVVTKNRGIVGLGAKGNGGTREDSTYEETISIMPPYLAINIWKRIA